MRDAKFASDFSWDVGGTMHFLFPWSTKEQDWDNDGSPDQASAANRDFLGSQVLYSFAALRYKMVGFGAGFDLQNFLSKQQLPGEGFERYHNLALTHVFGVVSARFWRDQIAVGLGIESTHAFIGYGEQPMGNFLPTPKDSMGFHGWGFLMGGVYRPEDGNWRVGFSYKPVLVAHPFKGRTEIGGLTAPSGVDVPGRLMLGGAIALGPGRALNITSKDGWVPLKRERPDGRSPSARSSARTGSRATPGSTGFSSAWSAAGTPSSPRRPRAAGGTSFRDSSSCPWRSGHQRLECENQLVFR